MTIFFGLGLLSSALVHAEKPFTVEDLVSLDRVSDPRLSPNGELLIYALRETDLEANKGMSGVWLADSNGKNARRLTAKSQPASSARFAPDGKTVYFLSARGGNNQIWRISLSGGEAEQVSNFATDVGSFVISPDGGKIAFSVEVFPDCGTDFDCTKKRLDAESSDKPTGTIHNKLFVRHWDTWANGTRAQLFVASVDNGTLSAPKLLSRGENSTPMDADVPSKPHGDDSEYAFSSDGRRVYFGARIAGTTEAWSTNFDLYEASVDGSETAKNLTVENLAWDSNPVPSANGKKLYYRAMTRANFEADRFRILERDLETGKTREVAPLWDRSPDALSVSSDGKTLYAFADDIGQRPLFGIDIATGKAKPLSGAGTVSGYALAKKQLVFVREQLTEPANLFSTGLGGGPISKLSSFNAARLSGVSMGDAEQFSFVGANNETVYAWLVKPVNFDSSKKYPIAFLVHGGPQGSFGNQFHYRWNPQTYAGQGFAAVMVDFHGSTGYGQKFTDSISGDWGGKPLEDLQKGIAAARAKYTFLDTERACALGGSYGGYMTNWIAGAWPDGFKCLVTHAGIFDKRFMSYSTEELWFDEWENGGVAWEHAAEIEVDNPVSRVKSWKTPMLVIHGMLDFRVPFEQGIAAFTALQRRGIASKFLWFPDENHWILKPANSILWHQTVNDWLHMHLDTAAQK